MVATEAGEILARFASDLEADVSRIRSEIVDLNNMHRGQVKIFSTEGVVANFLMPLIASFSQTWPGIRIRHTIAGSEGVVEGVGAGEADIGIAFDMTPTAQVETVSQFYDPLLLVVRADHPLAGRPDVPISEIISYPMALPVRGFSIRRLVDGEFKRLNLVANPIAETNSIDALRILALSSHIVTFLPSLPIKRELISNELVGARLHSLAPMGATHDICVMRDRRLPKAVIMFLELLARESTQWTQMP
jgi:DNA-binding transcriptional LysR family regulator